jgi:hypothetical protein
MSNLPVSSQSSTKGTKSRKENMRDQDRKGVESVLCRHDSQQTQ